jgi:hypothetical protein
MLNEVWLRPLVWTDYRVALLFLVIFPLVLLIWSLVQKTEAVSHLMSIYWKVSSLLAITVLLMIGSLQISYISSSFARILIPISLWFWIDLNEEIDDLPSSPFKLAVTAWRWGTTIYCVIGTLAILPFVPCAISTVTFQKPYCQIWLEAPWNFREIFLRSYEPKSLGTLGILALIIYTLSLGYFVIIQLGKQGRSAMPQ